MAFQSDELSEDERMRQAQSAGPVVSSVGASTAAPGGTPGDTAQAPAPAAQTQPTAPQQVSHGSGHINLQDFVSANKGSGRQMADKLAAPVQQAGDAYQKATQDALGELSEAASRGQPIYSRDRGGVVGNALGAEPNKNSGTYYDVIDANKRFAQEGYGGPADIDPAKKQALNAQAQDVTKQANAVADYAQRGQQLAKLYGQDTGYSPTMQGFDSLIANAEGGDRFSQLKQQYGGLDNTADRDAKAADIVGNAQAASAKVQGLYGQRAETWSAALEREMTAQKQREFDEWVRERNKKQDLGVAPDLFSPGSFSPGEFSP